MEDNYINGNNYSADISYTSGNREHIKKPTLFMVSLLYTVCLGLLIIVGTWAQHREILSGLIITEFVLVALPPVLTLLFFKYDLKKVLRLNKISFLNLLIIFGIMVFSLPAVGILNLGNLMIIKFFFGNLEPSTLPVASDNMGLLVNILVIGVSAGICEEILFRGTIQRGMERFGAKNAILFTAVLFGLMHLDFQKLLGTFLLGVLIGYIVYRTNSLFGGMFAHFTNNSLAVVLVYASQKFMNMVKNLKGVDIKGFGKAIDSDSYMDSILALPREQLIATAVVYAVMFLGCLAVLGALLYALKITTRDRHTVIEREMPVKKPGLLLLVPGLLIIGIKYYAQGIELLGKKSAFIDSVFRHLNLK